MPEVSIIVPNYNHAPYLKQRIDAILSQSFTDFELILLDDRSSDNSAAIMEAYRSHPKIAHIVINEQNSGSAFKQWEKGIGLARGNWIWIAESDDYCEPGLLQTLSPAFDPDKNYSIAFCQSIAFRNNGAVIMYTANKLMEETIKGHEFVSTRMLYGNTIFNASMAIFKKEYYYSITRRFTGYRFCGDWLFWIEMAMKGDVFISAKVLNYFRKHDKDISTKAFASGLFNEEYMRLADDLVDTQIIRREERQKMWKYGFRQLCLQPPADAPAIGRLHAAYRQRLGMKYYYWRSAAQAQRLNTRLNLLSLAVNRRFHLRSRHD